MDSWSPPTSYFGEVAYRVGNFRELRYEAFQIAPVVASGYLRLILVLLRCYSQRPFELVWRAAVDAPFHKRAVDTPALQRVDTP
ncbi:hypothetical protein [Streptomyces acidiscabies]|uniref:Uncharacterized protein n=1 Tax=Streptomyces acidiscabies TaxID=42234 RepID=A0A0L0K6N8_9ACTN|nr:hypothetical protein [Streptomyces acidiscabies]KND33516.1 hypothetical protein IQ63_19115 [Streptomyces acidiscabies]